MKHASVTQIGSDTPNMVKPPSAINVSDDTPTACPCDTINPSPRTTSIVASVVISALIRKYAITAPFTKPMAEPAATAAIIAINVLPVAFRTIAQSTPAKATVEPTDKSTSRDARQNIIVQATMPICEIDSASPSMFSMEKKWSTDSDIVMNTTIKITTRL